MNGFIAVPNQEYYVGMPICRPHGGKCDVVTRILHLDLVNHSSEFSQTLDCNLPCEHYIGYRPMTWWENLTHHCWAEELGY